MRLTDSLEGQDATLPWILTNLTLNPYQSSPPEREFVRVRETPSLLIQHPTDSNPAKNHSKPKTLTSLTWKRVSKDLVGTTTSTSVLGTY